MSLVLAENVEKIYRAGDVDIPALRGVSFELERASFACFIGPSGSGKTTLLNILGCLDGPTRGRVTIGEMDITTLTRRERAAFRGKTLGFIFQDFNLLPVLTVFENIEYPLLMVQSVPEAERRARVGRLLEQVGMADQRNKYPDQISGGQKQRVSIARALATNPALVLADEPTANLDHDTASRIIDLMREVRDEFGTTFLFSTHDQKIVGAAETIFVLEDGRLVDTQTKGGKNRRKREEKKQ